MREPEPDAPAPGTASAEPSTDRRETDRTREAREAAPPYPRHPRRWLIPTDPPPV